MVLQLVETLGGDAESQLDVIANEGQEPPTKLEVPGSVAPLTAGTTDLLRVFALAHEQGFSPFRLVARYRSGRPGDESLNLLTQTASAALTTEAMSGASPDDPASLAESFEFVGAFLAEIDIRDTTSGIIIYLGRTGTIDVRGTATPDSGLLDRLLLLIGKALGLSP